jgi:branched-chain amino acid transport system ATP-binding protein
MLELDGISVSYGPIQALDRVSLRAPEGKFVAILGANGAGKSTLLRTISGLMKPQCGTIRLSGRDIAGSAPNKIVRMGISHIPEGRGIFGQLTVQENLKIGAYAGNRRRGAPQRAREMASIFPILGTRRRQAGYSLSGGEQQMLAIARALMSEPTVLLADEVSLGLAPIVVQKVMSTLGELRDKGLTLLVVEQNANMAMKYADYVYLLKHGRVVAEGSPDSLRSSAELLQAYLGG